MKKASLLLAFLFCLASAQPKTCFSQSVAAGHWQLIQGDPFPDSVTQIVAGPGSLVYMATSDKGVFKSTDEGENWTEINTGLNGDLDITMLALGPNGDLLARDNYGNILYSKDAATWISDAVPWYWQYPGASATKFAFDSNGDAFVGTLGAGIYKMDSTGKWNQMMSPDIIPGVQAMVFDNQNRLIVHYDKLYRLKSDFSAIDTSWPISNTGNNPAQLIKTRWSSMLVVSDALYELTDQLQKISRNSVGGIIADSIGNLYAYYDADAVWDWMEKSTDHGVTWSTATIRSVSNIPYHGRFVEATSQGFITDGAGQPGLSVSFDTAFGFISIHELDENLKINNIGVDPSRTLQVFDNADGIWSSSDAGATWLLRVNRNHIQGQLMEDGKYYAFSTLHDSVFVSNDGLSYSQITLPTGVGRPAFYASPNGILWLNYGAERFMRSTDNGVTWNDFVHFTDPAPAYWDLDSGSTWGMIERGQNLWFATLLAIHFTSDDGVTWQVDTPHFVFNGISGGRGNSIIALSDGNGIHWLNPGDNVDSSWLDEDGAYAEDIDGTMLQIALPWYSENPQSFVRETKSGNILDTLCIVPNSLNFENFIDQPGNIIAVDSSGNIFGAPDGTGTSEVGLYKFVFDNASVTSPPSQSTDLDVSVTNNMLTITSPNEIQSAEMFDVTGRSMLIIPAAHSTMLSAGVESIPSGFYFIKAVTAEGTVVRKAMIVH
jgi:hypothetical protein